MMLALDPCSADNMMMIDEDYMDLISDTLFTTLANQPYLFPDSREIGKVSNTYCILIFFQIVIFVLLLDYKSNNN